MSYEIRDAVVIAVAVAVTVAVAIMNFVLNCPNIFLSTFLNSLHLYCPNVSVQFKINYYVAAWLLLSAIVVP